MRYGTGMVLVLTAGLLWSFQALIIRQMDDAGSWAILFWRSLTMVPVLTAFVAWRAGGAPLPAFRKAGAAGIFGGVALVVAMAGSIIGFQATTVANAAFLLAASPFLAAVLGWIMLREPVSSRTWIAIALAMVGIFIMVREGLSAGAWLGNIAALAGALGFAAFTVSLRWRRIDDSVPCVIIGALFAVATGAVVAPQLGETLMISAHDLLLCVLMGIVTMSGGMILYTFGSKVVPSAELALLSNTEVMLAPFWVWLLMGETASTGTFVGGAVLLAAILFNAYAGIRRLAMA